ncbi:MAG: hypothetical protein WCL10_00025 [Novosphingobium sp.]|uniref:hypothetical protein n=1 Tax=Novosphingobium sp. TaxID=1874826 RepID=UPI0030162738
MFDVELYNRKYDWLAASLLAVPLVWLFYGWDATLVATLLFALIGALKPLTRWLGYQLAAGVFAAGVVLLLSPLLQFGFYNSFCYGGAWSPAAGLSRFQQPDYCLNEWFGNFAQGVWKGPLRDLAMPVAGFGLMLLALPQQHQSDLDADGQEVALSPFSFSQIVARWGGLIFALSLWIGGSWYNYQAEQAALEERLAAYEAQQRQDERIAAEQAKRDAAEAAAQASQAAVEEAAKRVDANWLIGGWAVVQDYGGKPDPSLYCATDTGYTFKKGGKYIGASHEGTFSVKANVVTLSNRTSFEIGDPDYQSEHMPPLDLKVERRGDKLIIDGETYGRC